jgi:predicted metal-dependent hydrolase
MKSTQYPAQDLRRRTMAWAVKLKVNPRVVRVQGMRRKWGSCSSVGTVTLATDLLDQDEHFQDYVIVHELLHLRYSTHGRMFKALMSAHVPHWRRYEHAYQRAASVNAHPTTPCT